MQKVGEMIIMYITSGISIRNDVYYNHMDTRYSINYRVGIADIWTGKCVKWEDDRIVLDKYGMVIFEN